MDDYGLDPRSDEEWERHREIAHRAVDDMIDHLRSIREQRVWQRPGEDLLNLSQEGVPEEGQDLASIYDSILSSVLPYRMGNIHPRFWGWVIGTGTFSGALADFISSIMNSNNGGGYHAGTVIEGLVVNWAKQLMGYPEDASGLLVTGGSMANMTGLAVARNVKAGYDIRKEGVKGRLMVYGSTETHNSVQKSVELLGIGSDNYRRIAVNQNFEIDCDALEESIQQDVAAGHTPLCIVGTVGTVNTGAVDDIRRLREIADRYGVWLHVDGAFGAVTRLSKYAELADGIELADSIAFDFHKWLYINYEIGCVLVRRGKEHYQTFAIESEYLTHSTRGIHGTDLWFSDYGVELSRNFKALKVWVMIKELGLARFRRAITQNIEQARYLTKSIEESDELELLAPTSMNIVCFRYSRGDDLDALNEEILLRLHESGVAAPSYTRLDGKYAIRVAITNHRSRLEDFDILIDKVLELGRELSF